MEQSKNKNVVVGLLVVIIVILLVLVVLLATGTISFKSNDGTTECDNQDITTIESLINSVKITNFTFDKPHGMNFGGAEKSNALGTNMTIELECTNDTISGLTVNGYCLDLDNNKYLFNRGVQVFYCSNKLSHSQDPKTVVASHLFKTDGSNYTFYNEVSDSWENIEIDSWENIEIKYCKFDEAHLVLSDGSKLNTIIKLNYEKEFK